MNASEIVKLPQLLFYHQNGQRNSRTIAKVHNDLQGKNTVLRVINKLKISCDGDGIFQTFLAPKEASRQYFG